MYGMEPKHLEMKKHLLLSLKHQGRQRHAAKLKHAYDNHMGGADAMANSELHHKGEDKLTPPSPMEEGVTEPGFDAPTAPAVSHLEEDKDPRKLADLLAMLK